jgi:hypothetical protein
MNSKDAYERKMKAQLDEFGAEIDRLRARVDGASADARPWNYKHVEALEEKHRVARKKLGELRDTRDDAWEDLKTDIATAWDSVGETLKSVTKRFE